MFPRTKPPGTRSPRTALSAQLLTAAFSASSRLKKSCGPKPIELANSTVGKLSREALYSDAALLKNRRDAAILFSMSDELGLQLLEVGVGLEVGIGLRQREQLAQCRR